MSDPATSDRIPTACPPCGKRFATSRANVGKQARCAGCSQTFEIAVAPVSQATGPPAAQSDMYPPGAVATGSHPAHVHGPAGRPSTDIDRFHRKLVARVIVHDPTTKKGTGPCCRPTPLRENRYLTEKWTSPHRAVSGCVAKHRPAEAGKCAKGPRQMCRYPCPEGRVISTNVVSAHPAWDRGSYAAFCSCTCDGGDSAAGASRLLSPDRSMSRMCRSCCGKAISRPASRNSLSIARLISCRAVP